MTDSWSLPDGINIKIDAILKEYNLSPEKTEIVFRTKANGSLKKTYFIKNSSISQQLLNEINNKLKIL